MKKTILSFLTISISLLSFGQISYTTSVQPCSASIMAPDLYNVGLSTAFKCSITYDFTTSVDFSLESFVKNKLRFVLQKSPFGTFSSDGASAIYRTGKPLLKTAKYYKDAVSEVHMEVVASDLYAGSSITYYGLLNSLLGNTRLYKGLVVTNTSSPIVTEVPATCNPSYLSVSWAPVTTYGNIYQYQLSDNAQFTGANTQTCTDTTLVLDLTDCQTYCGKTLYFRVRGGNQGFTLAGAWSNTINFTVLTATSGNVYSCNPTLGTYTACYGGTDYYGSCSSVKYGANKIKLSVKQIEQDSITFRMELCSGQFLNSGTLYIKDSEVCGSILAQKPYQIGWWYLECKVKNTLIAGQTKLFYAVIVSASTDKFYAGPVSISLNASGQKPVIGISPDPLYILKNSKKKSAKGLPSSVDWSVYDSKPVRSQGSCGSCWAFATCALIENIAIRAKLPVQQDLSEQTLVSCVTAQSFGCNGGFPDEALEYARTTGVPNEACFPYSGTNSYCSKKCTAPSFTEKITAIKDYSMSGITVNHLREALQAGPAVVAFNVYNDYYSYSGGIYNYDGKSSYSGRHAVLLTGYNDNTQAFTIKNSWGSSRGEKGYYRMGYACVTSAVRLGNLLIGASDPYIVVDTLNSLAVVTISNKGTQDLVITKIQSDKLWLSYLGITLPLTIKPGENKQLQAQVLWTKTTGFQNIANLSFTSNDPVTPIYTLKVVAEKMPEAVLPSLSATQPLYADVLLPGTSGNAELMAQILNADSIENDIVATTDVSWLSIVAKKGEVKHIMYSFEENTTGSDRTGNIILSSAILDTSIMIPLTQTINTPPVITDIDISGNGIVYFSSNDFLTHYSDANNDSLTAIRITSLPDNGILFAGGQEVVAYQSVPLNELSDMYFMPAADWSGATTFIYEAFDGTNMSNTQALVNMDVVTSVGSPINTDGIIIYPNPANEVLHVDITDCDACIAKVELSDISGRIVLTAQLNNQKNQLNISTLERGVYLVKVEKGDVLQMHRIVIR